MAEPSQGWWKLTFLRRKKSQPKVLYEIPAECASKGSAGQHPVPGSAHSGGPASHAAEEGGGTGNNDPQLDARLERIVDKTTTASRGRHVKVSHSGRFKEKKRVRATLGENPDMFPGGGGDHHPARDENKMAQK